MEKIASFQVDHDKLTEGMYTSRIDGDVTTYDIRMVLPNGGVYLENAPLHTFEHLFATYVRSSREKEHIIYAGPMGCRTGFYFLVRNLSPEDSIRLVQETMDFIAGYEGEIPGAARRECGNYLDHDLPGANAMARKMQNVLKGWTPEMLVYRT